MDAFVVISLVSSLLWIFVIERIMRVFYQKQRTSRKIWLLSFAIFYGISVSISLIFRNTDISVQVIPDIIAVLLSYFIITLNYESTWVKRVVVTILTYIMTLSVGVLGSVLALILLPDAPLYSEQVANLATIITLPLAYLLFSLLQRFKNIRRNSVFFPSALVAPIGLLFMLMFSLFLGVSFRTDSESANSVYAVSVAAMLMGFNVLGFYLYDRLSGLYEEKFKLALQVKEREYYYAQCQLMQKSVDQVKSIRHDMKNHLATVRGYAAKRHAEEITDYVDGLLGEIKASEVYSDTGNVVFDSILNFKLQNAGAENIQLDIRLSVPPDLPMEVADVVTILGNLLDNALTAVADAAQKIIQLDVTYSRKSLYIQMENTFDGVLQYTEDEKQLATRKNPEEGGFGLKNIRLAVEKYQGQMNVSHQGDRFSVSILLYV